MKNTILLVFFILLALTLFYFVDTYGLLESNGTANVEQTIGKWKITLNGVDITLNNTLTVEDLIYAENENVEPGYFAPGTEASYEIEVDPSNTDVSIRYDINMDLTELKDHPNIFFSVKTGEIEIADNNGTYTGVIPLSAIQSGEKLKISITLIWENNEDYNEFDNTLIGSGKFFTIPITIKFLQYLGEEI